MVNRIRGRYMTQEPARAVRCAVAATRAERRVDIAVARQLGDQAVTLA